MLAADLDRYYTPSHVARSVIEAAGFSNARRCLDSACGDGRLLKAAQQMMPRIRCYGVDNDLQTIARLRLRNPDWILSKGDALSTSTWDRVRAAKESIDCDLALLNPPFSMQTQKGIYVNLVDFEGRCSTAMAHILMVASRTRPAVCAAIVPESLMYSDLDAKARNWLACHYSIRNIAEVTNTTFSGARANAAIITLKKKQESTFFAHSDDFCSRQQISGIIRGGLPLFQAVMHNKGIPLIHSTNLDALANNAHVDLCRVQPLSRGIVCGHVILLPRVGVPRPIQIKAIYLREKIQLSDCVIALTFTSHSKAVKAEGLLHSKWSGLVGLYRGTGARYITLQRLTEWLQINKIID